MKPYILVVEDEEAISSMLRYNLEHEGFEVHVTDDAEDALVCVDERRPDAILLDWMLPSISGVEACQRLRDKESTHLVPIIMLTAKGEETDRVRGLDSGADDYIVKPFSPNELIARVRAVLRRSRPAFAGKRLEFSGISVDLDAHKVTFGEEPIKLGPTEYRLLVHMMERPGAIFSREQLLDSVWGHDVYVESRTVDVHIRRLRKALEECDPGLEDIIKTVRSAGYILEPREGAGESQ